MRIRAACHVHSNWSYDGKWSLAEIAAGFVKRGYQAVMLTEHDRGFDEERRLEHREACSSASSSEILLVPGIEYSDARNCVHVLVWGDVPFIGENSETGKVLAAAAAFRGVSVLAHPSRKQAWRCFDPIWGGQLLGIECWNRKTDGWAPSPDAKPLLTTTGVLPFVGLDFHERRQFFPLATILEIEAPISEFGILESLHAKRCSSEAFGIPIVRFSYGIAPVALRAAEFLRRSASPLYRKVVAT